MNENLYYLTDSSGKAFFRVPYRKNYEEWLIKHQLGIITVAYAGSFAFEMLRRRNFIDTKPIIHEVRLIDEKATEVEKKLTCGNDPGGGGRINSWITHEKNIEIIRSYDPDKLQDIQDLAKEHIKFLYKLADYFCYKEDIKTLSLLEEDSRKRQKFFPCKRLLEVAKRYKKYNSLEYLMKTNKGIDYL